MIYRILIKTLLLLLIVRPVIHLNAQSYQRINGFIVDSISALPVDFVSIGIIGKNVGTVSNDSGVFHIRVPNELLSENLTISRIGYLTKTLKIHELTDQKNTKIFLIPKSTEIDEVQINFNKLTSKTIGNINRTDKIVCALTSDTSNLGLEVGTVFHLPNNAVYIKDFNFHISYNRPDSAKLRLNIYEYNNKEIGRNILKENIYFTITRKNSGDYKVDLSKYRIHASNEIFIAIENVAIYISQPPDPKIKFDEYSYNKINISCTLLGSKGYFKKVSMGKWEKGKYSVSPSYWITILK